MLPAIMPPRPQRSGRSDSPPPSSAPASGWIGLLPQGRDPLSFQCRRALLSLYGAVVQGAPPDIAVAQWRRGASRALQQQAGLVASALNALLRRRVRAIMLGSLLRQGRVAPPPPDAILAAIDTLGAEDAVALLPPGLESTLALGLAYRELAAVSPDKAAAFAFPDPGPPTPDHLTVAQILVDAARGQWRSNVSDAFRESADLSIAPSLLSRWKSALGESEAVAHARALGQSAPTTLRANTLRITRDALLEELRAQGIDARPTGLCPHGINLDERVNLGASPRFRDGYFEVQDEGSQLVSLALDPKPGWRVLDACGGGGGKTLHLSALMKNRGEVHWHDLSPTRAEDVRHRCSRAGADNVRILPAGETIDAGNYDAVLVDAPCLGLGTLRRNPDLAWRGPIAKRIAEVTALQHRCLELYAPLVRPGGILVYATCSIEPEETTATTGAFLAAHPEFKPDPIAPRLTYHGVPADNPATDGVMTILPHRTTADAFHIARFRRS